LPRPFTLAVAWSNPGAFSLNSFQKTARAPDQARTSAEHYARGIRNAVAITTDPADDTLWVVQHGRDRLGDDVVVKSP
jgi:glucose/arabinose dehydrogenase